LFISSLGWRSGIWNIFIPDQDPGVKKASDPEFKICNSGLQRGFLQAIQSSPEQRLTLSQIYDWMVTTVPYFKERSDVNSSAGWKV
jgi:hypothetical protein